MSWTMCSTDSSLNEIVLGDSAPEIPALTDIGNLPVFTECDPRCPEMALAAYLKRADVARPTGLFTDFDR